MNRFKVEIVEHIGTVDTYTKYFVKVRDEHKTHMEAEADSLEHAKRVKFLADIAIDFTEHFTLAELQKYKNDVHLWFSKYMPEQEGSEMLIDTLREIISVAIVWQTRYLKTNTQ